jgi:hypothetical protein
MRFLDVRPRVRDLLMVSGAFMLAAPANAADAEFRAAAPEGFEDLQSERQVLLDVYFGGQKLGASLATIRPGALKFEDPAAVARLLPNLASLPLVAEALSQELPSNSGLVCSSTVQRDCGRLQPDSAGIILDEDRFGVEIFLNPSLLALAVEQDAAYLPLPEAEPSFISLFGATVSGSDRGDHGFHVQNRSLASIGRARIRSDSSISTEIGLSVDNLTLESDSSDWRYLGGVFWAPGSELVGRRKIIGIGATTQLDTRVDKDALAGTPLTLFLQQPGRVEVLVDGRIISSRIYGAGHRLIDTSTLPNGSYDLVLRIQEDGQPTRIEQRFFIKGASLAPAGHPLLSGFVGLLQPSGGAFSTRDRMFYYQAAARYRLAPTLGVDATLLGIRGKAVLEAGGVLTTRLALLRLGSLVSTDGDVGVAIRASSAAQGPLTASFDLRSVHSRSGKPLLPISASGRTFSEDARVGVGRRGTYVQGIATVDYRFRQGALRLTGLYRQDGSEDPAYSIAASVEVPVVRTNGWDLRLDADIRKSDTNLSSFVGVRFLLTGGDMSVSGRTGVVHRSDRDGRPVGLLTELQSGLYRQLTQRSELSADVAVGRDPDGGYARAGSHLRSPLVNLRADALHQFGDGHSTTQYAASADAGIVLEGRNLSVGAREMNDSAIVVSVTGNEEERTFDVLIDEVVRGSVSTGSSVALYLEPYETYQIRLRSQDSQAASFQTGPREVTLFPGNAVKLHWEVTPLVVLFGRAVDPNGKPIALADIRGLHGIGRSDADGYFQIEANRQDTLQLRSRTGVDVSAGDMMCR